MSVSEGAPVVKVRDGALRRSTQTHEPPAGIDRSVLGSVKEYPHFDPFNIVLPDSDRVHLLVEFILPGGIGAAG